jgi:hypothetical protein
MISTMVEPAGWDLVELPLLHLLQHPQPPPLHRGG